VVIVNINCTERTVGFEMCGTCTDGDAQFWTDVCQAGEAKNAESFVEWVCNEIMAAKPSDRL
jgi:hypothetical protein